MSTAEASAFLGSLEEFRSSAGRRAKRVIVLPVDGLPDDQAKALTVMVDQMATLASAIIERNQDERLKAIVELLVPNVEPSPNRMREALMAARARTAVVESGDLLTAAEIAKMAGFSESNPGSQPNKWKRNREIFAVHHGGLDYYPAFGLDRETHRPLKAMADVLAVFDNARGPWALASWFITPNSFLGGKRPKDLLATQPDRVVAAAHDELAGVAHG